MVLPLRQTTFSPTPERRDMTTRHHLTRTHTPARLGRSALPRALGRLALCALLAQAGLASAQVAGSSTATTTVDVTQVTAGWSVKKSILGKTVYNETGAKVGKVEDLILSADRSITYAIVGAGGYLGIGRHDVVVPVTRIVDRGGRIVMDGATKDSIKAMPVFDYADDGALRARALTAAEADISKARLQVGVLEKKAAEATADAKTKLTQQGAALQADVKATETKVSDMRHAAAARWKEFSADLNAATAKLRKSTDAPAAG